MGLASIADSTRSAVASPQRRPLRLRGDEAGIAQRPGPEAPAREAGTGEMGTHRVTESVVEACYGDERTEK